MSRPSSTRTGALVLRHLAHGWAASAVVGLLVAVAVLAVAVAPRALARLGDAELRHALGVVAPTRLDLTATGRIGIVEGTPGASADDLLGDTADRIEALPRGLPEPLRGAAGRPAWVVRSPANPAGPTADGSSLDVRLAIDLDWLARVRIVEGAAPVAWTGDELQAGLEPQPPLEIAMSRAAADLLGFRVGDRIDDQVGPLVVSGIFEPRDPSDAYFAHTGDVAVPTVDRQVTSAPAVATSVYVAPDSVAGLQTSLLAGSLTAWVPIDPSGLSYADAALLQVQVRRLGAAATELPYGGRLSFRSGLPDEIAAVVDRVAATSALLALSASGLLGVLVAVFALGVQSVVDRRRLALALVSARGASGGRLRALMVLEGVIIAGPGAALAMVAAAIVLPAHAGRAGWALPLLVALTVPALFALLAAPGSAGPRRDLRLRARHRTRWVAETVVVGLAALSLLLLARRGLVGSARAVGIDPLLAATPLLLAIAVCIGVLRVYPLPLLLLQRRLRSRGGAVAVVGAARAVRDPALGFAASLALVVGIAVVVFSAVMATTVRAGLVQGAHDEVGADLRVSAPLLDDQVVGEVRGLAGVRAAVGIGVRQAVELDDGAGVTRATLVVADTAALHATRPDLPVLTPGADGRAPVLLSDDWADSLLDGDVTVEGRAGVVAGRVPVDALPGLARRWVLVDASALVPADLEVVLVRLDDAADPQAVGRGLAGLVVAAQAPAAATSIEVVSADAVLAETRASPAVGSLGTVLGLGALASLMLTLLTVVLASLAAAARRHRLLGVLRILGMSPRQLTALLAWEVGPVALTAVVVGSGLGLALPWVVTRALDLRPFVGGRVAPQPVVDPWLVGAAVAAFVVVVVVAVAVALAVGRRVVPAAALRMGEG